MFSTWFSVQMNYFSRMFVFHIKVDISDLTIYIYIVYADIMFYYLYDVVFISLHLFVERGLRVTCQH